MALGQSQPWQQSLQVLSGENQMDATAILDYFAPLYKWLQEQNRGKQMGWDAASAACVAECQLDPAMLKNAKPNKPATAKKK